MHLNIFLTHNIKGQKSDRKCILRVVSMHAQPLHVNEIYSMLGGSGSLGVQVCCEPDWYHLSQPVHVEW